MSNTTDLASVEIIFDNGGSVTMQTETYAHLYDNAEQAAHDYKLLVNGGDTADWEGNDSDAEVTKYDGYRFFDHSEIQAILTAGRHETSWGNEATFFRTLGMTREA
jgi:hypothetical protein